MLSPNTRVDIEHGESDKIYSSERENNRSSNVNKKQCLKYLNMDKKLKLDENKKQNKSINNSISKESKLKSKNKYSNENDKVVNKVVSKKSSKKLT